MAIKYINESDVLVFTEYEGRVIETCVNRTIRQWLVWLGDVGEFYEQFRWITSSELLNDVRFPGQTVFIYAKVDVSLKGGTGDPIMWVNYFAWKSHITATKIS